jgi:hypothetical protein
MAYSSNGIPTFLLSTSTSPVLYSATDSPSFPTLSTISTRSKALHTSISTTTQQSPFYTSVSSPFTPQITYATHIIEDDNRIKEAVETRIILACVITAIISLLILVCCGLIFRCWRAKRKAKRESDAAAARVMPAGWTVENGYADGQPRGPRVQVGTPTIPPVAMYTYRYA